MGFEGFQQEGESDEGTKVRVLTEKARKKIKIKMDFTSFLFEHINTISSIVEARRAEMMGSMEGVEWTFDPIEWVNDVVGHANNDNTGPRLGFVSDDLDEHATKCRKCGYPHDMCEEVCSSATLNG
jgi:hypothetical protein